jgi:hypothetical protein
LLQAPIQSKCSIHGAISIFNFILNLLQLNCVRVIALLTLILGGPALALADSNLNADHSKTWAPAIGWTEWRPSAETGAHIGRYVCSGYVYAANAGWINLGDGTPANGIYYQNNSDSDFGINVDLQGNLRGLAYGANIGWINFEAVGEPRLNLQDGRITGFAHGANIGWVNLGDANVFMQVDYVNPGVDSDRDGIPDAWELSYAGDLLTLSQSLDKDSDGSSDLQEYVADTDPFDPSDRLQLLQIRSNPENRSLELSWTSRPSRNYQVEWTSKLGLEAIWVNDGLTAVPGTGGILSQILSQDTAQPERYFRIRTLRPLSQ